MRPELENLLKVISEMDLAEVPRLIGELAEVSAHAQMRLTSPSTASPAPDELLNVDEVAMRLGMSRHYVYRNSRRLGATHVGRSLRFPASAIDKAVRKGAR